MTENEFLLSDRITKIKSINEQYDLLNNSYIAFSGGKDSTMLHYLIDEALPGNKIPRVYSNTGIELIEIRKFVFDFKDKDERFVILQPKKNITKTLQEYGYPFKSKMHSNWVKRFQKNGMNWAMHNYLQDEQATKKLYRPCPNVLKYQFSENFKLKISDMCCYYLKEEPMIRYSKENNKPIFIDGIMREEGGRRAFSNCLSMDGNKVKSFHPLSPVSKDFENWYIESRNIKLCCLYYEPYNFTRTGCKGCPFALDLQDELNTLQKFFPNERKQCEIIWKPVYDEYRRIGYRLEKENDDKLFDF